MNGREAYRYVLSSAKTQARKQLVTPAIDLGYLVRNGLVLYYEDAQKQIHQAAKEESPGKIFKNAKNMFLYLPTGTVTGPMYLVWRGSACLMRRRKVKKGESSREGNGAGLDQL